MSNTEQRKNVVIVGGGAGGSRTAHLLSQSLDASRFNLILIDSRPYFIILPATARLSVTNSDSLEDNALVPLKDIFVNGRGTFVQGRVTSIERIGAEAGGYVVLSNGEHIRFEVLLLSLGSNWSGPFSFPDSKEDIVKFFESSRAAIKAAQNIVLVGGGAVGVELAGEIGDIWPDKSITIVQGDERLLNNAYPLKLRKAVETRLRARKVDIVFDDFVDEQTQVEGEIKTRHGKNIKADLVLSTYGTKPNTEFIAKSLGSNVLSERRLLKVQPTLQLVDFMSIFAVGDVIDYPEQKQLDKAHKHASVAAANIVAYLQGKPLKKKYQGSGEMILITIGKNGGVGYVDTMGGFVLGDWFARLVKSKTLFVGPIRESVGL